MYWKLELHNFTDTMILSNLVYIVWGLNRSDTFQSHNLLHILHSEHMLNDSSLII